MKYLLYIFASLFCGFLQAQQIKNVDFESINADVIINPYQKNISGAVTYEFDVLQPTDSIYIDAQNMEIEHVLLNKQEVVFKNDGKKLWVLDDFQRSTGNVLSIVYSAHPKKAMYFLGWGAAGKSQVWTQGQGKYTSNWLPSFDDMNEKTTLNLKVQFPQGFKVVSNGILEKSEVKDSLQVWNYTVAEPVSNYLFAIAAGKYAKQTITSKHGIPIEMYYYPEDSLKFEPTYRYTAQIFNFLESEIGVPYPWANYKQIPVADFLYAGMENMSATIFSDAYMVDGIGFKDRNYVNVNAHELAHQWFGDLVTETSGTHHWLQEGFATYYALLAERDIFGNDYYKMRLYEYAKELQAQDSLGGSTALLNPKSSSLTFYKKGAWLLHALRTEIGDTAFKLGVKQYLQTYKHKNVNSENFINQVEKASGRSLDTFFDLWLQSESFPIDSILRNARDEMSYYIKYIDNLNCAVENSSDFLESPERYYFEKQQVLKRNSNLITPSVFENNGAEVRQTIASVLTEIPFELKSDYESLLDDPSYQTQEIALYNLWVNFPEERSNYLQKTKGFIGFNSKNIRQLWLALALSTPEFEPENNLQYANELIGYSGPVYGFEVRELAFNYINALQLYNEVAIKNLIQAITHHNWRLSKLAKQQLTALENNPNYKTEIDKIQSENVNK